MIINKTILRLYICFAVFIWSHISCLNNSTSKQNINTNNSFIDGVHPVLLYVIKNYSNSNIPEQINIRNLDREDYWITSMGLDENPDNHYFFVLKFFEKNENLYFSLWLNSNFPDFIRSPEGVVKVNKDNLFYFQIGSINLVIIDNNLGDGYDLFSKNEIYKINAIKIKKHWEKKEPIFINKDPVYNTYQVTNNIIKKAPEMVPSKYEVETLIIFEDSILAVQKRSF